MRKRYSIFVFVSASLFLILFACQTLDDNISRDNPTDPGNPDYEEPPDTTTNEPPSAPSDPSPTEGATGISLSVTLAWLCEDPDDDTLTFDIYFGTTSNPPLIISGFEDIELEQSGLNYETTYYWKVVADDGHEHSTSSVVWSFTTFEEGINHPPETPSNPNPSDSAVGVTTIPTLSWTSSDPDGDTLTFDVYFSDSSPPQLVSENQSETFYTPARLDTTTTYYWKIIAKDGVTMSLLRGENIPSPENKSDKTSALKKLLPKSVQKIIETINSTNDEKRNTRKFTEDSGSREIRSTDELDGEAPSSIWSFTTVGGGNQPPGTPSNPVPANQAAGIALTPVLSWTCIDPDEDPLTYDVYFGTLATPPIVSSDQSDTSYTPGTLTEGTTYYWKIKAKDDSNLSTDGQIWTFSTEGNQSPAAPSNANPGNGNTGIGITPTLSWTCSDPDEDPLTYDVYFGTDGQNLTVASDDQSTTEFQPNGGNPLNHSTQYFWMIVAKDDHDNETEGSVWSFTTIAEDANQPPSSPSDPVPASESTDLGITNIQLTWSCSDPEEDELAYDLFFGTDQGALPEVSTGQSQTQYDLGELQYSTTYYWRIKAKDDENETIGPIWSFTTLDNESPDEPSIPDPENGSEDVALEDTLSWTCSDPEEDPLTYDVLFGTNQQQLETLSSEQTETEYFIGDLDFSTNYFWQIVAKDNHENETSSPIWSFTTLANQPPAEPSIPYPDNGAEDVALNDTLSWTCSDPEEDSLTYDVLFGTNEQQLETISSEQTETEYFIDDLEFSTTYYWQIVAQDNHENETSSLIWSFTTLANQPPAEPSIPYPEDDAEDVALDDTLSWTCSDPENDPITYYIYLGIEEDPPLVDSTDHPDTSYILGELEPLSTYYWKIRAIDSYDNETESSIWSFSTGDIYPGFESEFELGQTDEMITMVWIPSGSFWMGAQENEDDADDDEYPRHEVTISEGFWMGKYEVTQAQWEAVAEYENFEWPDNPNRPAENISYDDIMDDFLPDLGNAWRLPTEAEWEYACRAGHDDSWFWWGSSYDDLGDYAWYRGNSDTGDGCETHDVGEKTPNPWGLYNMHGNVREWCNDWYDGDYYDNSPGTDPPGAENGTSRVIRGGCWPSDPVYCRSASKISGGSFVRINYVGFRLVRDAD
ncbi:MAG: SUMF1/EgtB/PvdO family nonheme iron enzyme [Candidatus Electryonea clarkiae]|nr:SUMF1/EgtB/PvdO family nonheme iron enzyme [Candidatus Electryonea clarkiae]